VNRLLTNRTPLAVCGRVSCLRPTAVILAGLLVTLGAFVSAGVAPASAACTLTGATLWSDDNSNWNNAVNWSTGTVPNGTGTNVCITSGTAGTPVTVTMDSFFGPSVDNLQVGSNNTLSFNIDSSLTVVGPQIINGGDIVINGGDGLHTYLVLDNTSTALSGGGTVTLTTVPVGGASVIEQGVAGVTLTNVDNTIQGTGVIGNGGLALNNEGIIDPGLGGTLFLNGTGGITNTNLLEATNTGTLEISTTVNNAAGTITANGGTVVLLLATIQGGTLTTVNGGTLETASGVGGAATLDGSTLGPLTLSTGSTYTTLLSSTTTLLGTINNSGNFQLTGGDSTLFIGSNVTLQGGGTVTLSTGSFLAGASGFTLTNVNNTIQGAGTIGDSGLALSNEATIDANVSGGTLTLYGLTQATNTNLLEATNNGTLQISTTVDNAGGTIMANGGTVNLAGVGSLAAIIQGGTLTNVGGTLGVSSSDESATLDGSTAAGPITINGSYLTAPDSSTILVGTINNHGNLQFDAGPTTMVVGSGTQPTVTLQGGGMVTLSTPVAGGFGATIQPAVNGGTLVNVDNTIQGEGLIGNGGLTLINEVGGIINANSGGGALTTTLLLDGTGGVTNTGLMEATNSGVLEINTTTNNTGGTITANGGTVEVNTAAIQGGTLTTSNGGLMETLARATLDGSTHGTLTISSGSTYTAPANTVSALLGTINNQGTLQVTAGAGGDPFLLIDDNVTLEGGGTMTLSTSSTAVPIVEQGGGQL